MNNNSQHIIDIIWLIAERLRHDYKRSEYGKVILPFTVLRRLDCVLAPTKSEVLKAAPEAVKKGEKLAEYLLNNKAGQSFHNRSQYDFARLLNEPDHVAANLNHYINGFSTNIREILEYFSFAEQIVRLDKANLLYQIIASFQNIDLHPDRGVDNHMMGTVFEELIRRFSEQSNETAGEHFTPREVIKLMVNLLFLEDRDLLRKEGIVRTLYDPACGTGGMLSIAEEHLRDLNPRARLEVFGQEVNPESYAVCKADMVIKGHNAANIKFGNSFTTDGLADERFDYMLSNPPFGVEWKKVEKTIRDEYANLGYSGRFGAGLPRISDGSLLFLQHMLAKRKENDGGSRIAIVFNGSPLFSGGAGSGESEIRRWIIENDWLEAIVALPDQLFYNTGIPPYIWIVSNRKSPRRKGKIQLINAVSFYKKMRKSLGNKRNEISEENPDHIAEITKIYGAFESGRYCKIFDNADFGYRRIIVERPLRYNFQITSECIKRISNLKLSPNVLNQASQVLNQTLKEDAGASALYKNQAEFTDLVKLLWRNSGFNLPPAKQLHVIIMEIGERDETAEPCTDVDNNLIADPELRDFENVPLKESVDVYFAREVAPNVPDAWINKKVRDDKDGEVGKVGYEIPFIRHFFEYEEPPDTETIETEIEELEKQIQVLLQEVIN